MRFFITTVLCVFTLISMAGNDKREEGKKQISNLGKEVLVVVDDVLGETHYSKVIILSDHKSHVIAFDPYNRIKPGLYKIIGTSNNDIYNKNLAVKK